MLAATLALTLGCQATAVDSGDTDAPPLEATILSPEAGERLFADTFTRLEAEVRDADGWSLDLVDAVWTVHGTEWQAQGNGVDALLPQGWGLLIVEATADGRSALGSVEIDVERTAGDTGTTDTTPEGGLAHTIAFDYTPSPAWQADGYSPCTAAYGADLTVRTGGELCPYGNITWEGALNKLSTDCEAVLRSSIPSQVAYGMDTSNATSWRVWVEGSGTWNDAGTADYDGSEYVLTTTNRLDASGSYAGTAEVTMRFKP